MVSTSALSGTWRKGAHVSRGAAMVIALYANAHGSNSRQTDVQAAYKAEQAACFAILREWVRQHIREKPEMHKFVECMYEIDGRGYLFDFDHVAWGNENDPFYLLVKRTLDEMQGTFNCKPHSNHSTPYALEYSYVMGKGMGYDTVRLGAYAYAVGVKVEVEVAADFMNGEGL